MITTLEGFVSECVSEFDDNLTGILFYGSTARSEDSPFSDRDLILTAKEYDFGLVVETHEILKRTSFLVDLPIIFHSEIPPNVDYFRVINHGCYFLELLKRGKVLYGRNIFLDYPKPSQEALQASLFEKLSEYAQYCRRNFIEANREKSLGTNYQLNRRLVKSVHDLLWLSGTEEDCDSNCMRLLKEKLPQLLTDEEWKFLEEASDPKKTNILASNLSHGFFRLRLSVMEKIYHAAQQLVFPSL